MTAAPTRPEPPSPTLPKFPPTSSLQPPIHQLPHTGRPGGMHKTGALRHGAAAAHTHTRTARIRTRYPTSLRATTPSLLTQPPYPLPVATITQSPSRREAGEAHRVGALRRGAPDWAHAHAHTHAHAAHMAHPDLIDPRTTIPSLLSPPFPLPVATTTHTPPSREARGSGKYVFSVHR